MEDLQLDLSNMVAYFDHQHEEPYTLVRFQVEDADDVRSVLLLALRRCYASDETIRVQASRTGRSRHEVLSARLPGPGSIMSGDFGEILTFLFQGAEEYPREILGPKKWRLKQDRTKPSPGTDVVQFSLPRWPEPSEQDRLLCAEVKTKATRGGFKPIAKALEGCRKDRLGRLVRTLAWLKERALTEDLGSTKIDHLDRFIQATDHPRCTKVFRAVAVICESLEDTELQEPPESHTAGCKLIVIVVPQLKDLYESVFAGAIASVTE